MTDPEREQHPSPAANSALVIAAVGTGALLACLGAGLVALLARIQRLHVEVELEAGDDRRIERGR